MGRIDSLSGGEQEIGAKRPGTEKNISNLILRMVVCGPLNELVFPGNKCIRHIIHNPLHSSFDVAKCIFYDL